jgi:hypothetical protein
MDYLRELDHAVVAEIMKRHATETIAAPSCTGRRRSAGS